MVLVTQPQLPSLKFSTWVIMHLSGGLAVTVFPLPVSRCQQLMSFELLPKSNSQGKHSSLHYNFNCIKYRHSKMENLTFYLFDLCYLIIANTSIFLASAFHICVMMELGFELAISTFTF